MKYIGRLFAIPIFCLIVLGIFPAVILVYMVKGFKTAVDFFDDCIDLMESQFE